MKKCVCLFSLIKLKIKPRKHDENDMMNGGPQMRDPDDLDDLDDPSGPETGE